MRLADPVTRVAGVGAKRAELLSMLGILTVEDLLWHMPIRYEDRRKLTPARELSPGCACVFHGAVSSVDIRRAQRGGNRNLYIATLDIVDFFDMFDIAEGASAAGYGSPQTSVRVILFGGPRSFGALAEGSGISIYGEPSQAKPVRGGSPSMEFVSPEYVLTSDPRSEPPAEWMRIMPVYPTTSGLSRKKLAEIVYRCAASEELTIYDPIPDGIVKKHSFPSYIDALRGVHAPKSFDEISSSRERLAYHELYMMQKKITAAGAARAKEAKETKVANGVKTAASLADGRGRDLAERFVLSLPFPVTDSQRTAMDDIAADVGGALPMRRLLQGDVGSGKTVVALYALAYAAGAGRQGAVMVPTSILSDQFCSVCERYLAPLGIRCLHLTGKTPAKPRRAIIDSLACGDADVVVGTHALIEKDVRFASLGLVVIDEQQRFGVEQREKLHSKGKGVHLLSMSATPIPRTLCMALYGDMDTSLLREKPPGRKPVITRLLSDNHIDELYTFISERVSSGESCFWVCPLVDPGDGDEPASVVDRASEIERHMKGIEVGRLYGRMPQDEKSSAIDRFAARKTPILVSTTVIEVGVDVPEANIMIIEGASRFGLSQLHQLRGRVGRGGARGVCILLDAASRIAASEGLGIISNCDDGFEIAEEDLRLRGAGELGGLRQHGDLAFKAASLPDDLSLLERARDDCTP